MPRNFSQEFFSVPGYLPPAVPLWFCRPHIQIGWVCVWLFSAKEERLWEKRKDRKRNGNATCLTGSPAPKSKKSSPPCSLGIWRSELGRVCKSHPWTCWGNLRWSAPTTTSCFVWLAIPAAHLIRPPNLPHPRHHMCVTWVNRLRFRH